MGREEEQEKARQDSHAALAKAERDREEARRKSHQERAKKDVSVIAHGPATK